MFGISLNYKTASLDLRQKLAFDEEQIQRLFEKLGRVGIRYGVYLSTCNRCELYGIGDAYATLDCMADIGEADVDTLKEEVFIYTDQSAMHHLFYVTSGLDSMVKGEDEILGQVKRAYEASLEAGRTDYELNEVFQGAISCAKKIKTDTMVSKTSVSVATLAAALCHRFANGQKKKVLVIGGSGEIGSKVIKNLISYDEFTIAGTSRRRSTHGDVSVKHVDYTTRYDHIGDSDIVISATKSPHFTLVYKRIKEVLTDDRKRLLIDLAVPRDIDASIGEMDGVQLYTIDDFDELAKDNERIKQKEFALAESIIESELEELFKRLTFHRIMPLLGRASGIPFDQFVYRYRDTADAEEFKMFARVLSKMLREEP